VRQPTTMIGKKAVELLLKLMNGKNGSLRLVLKPELIIRESCAVNTMQRAVRKSVAQSVPQRQKSS